MPSPPFQSNDRHIFKTFLFAVTSVKSILRYFIRQQISFRRTLGLDITPLQLLPPLSTYIATQNISQTYSCPVSINVIFRHIVALNLAAMSDLRSGV